MCLFSCVFAVEVGESVQPSDGGKQDKAPLLFCTGIITLH